MDFGERTLESFELCFINREDSNVDRSCNDIYDFYKNFLLLDTLHNKNHLDEFNGHQFLELYNEPLTVLELRQTLKSLDSTSNNNLSLIEYLAWKFKKTIEEIQNAPQGTPSKMDFERAQNNVDQVLAALENVKQQVLENEVAVRELRDMERKNSEKKKHLMELSENISIGIVHSNKAKNELEQLKSEDPLPLRRAKITQEATLRRVVTAQQKLQNKLNEAIVELERIKKIGGIGNGKIYFLEREMFEADFSLPNRMQKYDHSKPFSFCPAA